MGAASAVLGFGMAGWLMAWGALRPLYDLLSGPHFVMALPSLDNLLGRARWELVALLGVGVTLALWRARRLPDPEGVWAWWGNGLALGAIGVAAWLAAAPAGWGYGLSMTGPTRDLAGWALGSQPAPVTWGTGLVVGILVGSLLSRLLAGRFHVAPAAPRMLGQRFAGGVLMGIGGTLAAGCNIGNGFTGFSILATQSVVAMGFIALGRWAVDAACAWWAARVGAGRRAHPAPVTPGPSG